MKNILYVILLSSILFSCTDQVPDSPLEEPTIIGLWVKNNSDTYDVVKIYTKKEQFKEDKAGLKFSENGDFVFRDECSCPNSVFENYFGNYTMFNDSTINVTFTVKEKPKENTFKIKALTLDTLKVSFK